MDEFKVIQIKEKVTAKNDEEAALVRKELKEHKTYFVNLMSSPGAGKTTLLCNLINKLTDKGLRVGVLEADIDGQCDAETIMSKTKAKSIQIHTGGACHLTAQMTKEGLENIDLDEFDIVFLENIGNLVCPAEFDTGANTKLVLLSVPEGDDKPLKYPLMFEVADLVCVTKIDTIPIFNFNKDKFIENVHKRNEKADVLFISAKKDENVDKVADYLFTRVEAFIK
jgi:hydrogenase nickel incorporation protein HypB